MQPDQITYLIALRLRSEAAGGVHVSAQKAFLSSPARIIKHFDSTIKSSLDWTATAEGVLDVAAVNAQAEQAPICVNMLHRNDVSFGDQDDLQVEADVMPLSDA